MAICRSENYKHHEARLLRSENPSVISFFIFAVSFVFNEPKYGLDKLDNVANIDIQRFRLVLP